MPPNAPGDAEPSANTRVLKTASGGSPASRMRLTQSMAFLSSGGIEALYSGETMKMPWWTSNSALSLRAFSGGPSAASRSPS